jgi:lipopolysaccharide assembly protein A
MKIIRLLFWAAIFLALLLFSLHNQQDTAVYFFFGTVWHAPLVLVVLAAFATGLAIGALGMVPRWWKHRMAARRAAEDRGGGRAEHRTPWTLT